MNNLLTIIIVSFNSEDFIERCVSSVLKFLPKNCDVIVLDNGSTDKTVEKLNKFLPRIDLIKSEENLGFARGNNMAIKSSNSEFLFFLNPDTEIKLPIFEEMISVYRKTPNIGILAPKLVMANGEVQPSVKNLPTVFGAFQEYVLGIKGAYSELVPKTTDLIEIGMAYGAALLISRSIFEKVGGFDEKYFLYYEDVDLCRKVRISGRKIFYYPKLEITHLVGATKSIENKFLLNTKSARIYHGNFKYFLLQLIFFLGRLRRKLGYV